MYDGIIGGMMMEAFARALFLRRAKTRGFAEHAHNPEAQRSRTK